MGPWGLWGRMGSLGSHVSHGSHGSHGSGSHGVPQVLWGLGDPWVPWALRGVAQGGAVDLPGKSFSLVTWQYGNCDFSGNAKYPGHAVAIPR